MDEPRIAHILHTPTPDGQRRILFTPDGLQEVLPDSDDIEDRLLREFDIDSVEWGPQLGPVTFGIVTDGPHVGQTAWIKGDGEIGDRAQFQKVGKRPVVYEVYDVPEDGPPLLRFVEGPD